MIGEKFGRWTVLRELPKSRKRYFECQCDCGIVRAVQEASLKSGASKSCGCLKRDRAKDVICDNSRKRIDTNAKYQTNFDAIERDRPYKNNKSGQTGVHWCKSVSLWRAYIQVQKKSIYLGGYHDINDAIAARKAAEKQYFLPLIAAKEGGAK